MISNVESNTSAGDTILRMEKRTTLDVKTGRAMVNAMVMVVSLLSSPLCSTVPCVFVKRRKKRRERLELPLAQA